MSSTIDDLKKQLETKSPENPLIDIEPIDRYKQKQLQKQSDPNVKEFTTNDGKGDTKSDEPKNPENTGPSIGNKKQGDQTQIGDYKLDTDKPPESINPDEPNFPDDPNVKPFSYTGDQDGDETGGDGDGSFNELFDTENMDKTIDWLCGMFKIYYPKTLYDLGKININKAKREVTRGNLDNQFIDVFSNMNENVKNAVQLDEDTFKIWKKQTKEFAKDQSWGGISPTGRWLITTGIMAVPPAIEMFKARKENREYFRMALDESRKIRHNNAHKSSGNKQDEQEPQPTPPNMVKEEESYKKHGYHEPMDDPA